MAVSSDDFINAISSPEMRKERQDAKRHKEAQEQEDARHIEAQVHRQRQEIAKKESENNALLLRAVEEAQKRGNEFLHKSFDIGFSDEENRIKRNFLIVSSVSIICKIAKVDVAELNISGITLPNLQPLFFDIMLLVLVGYHFISFVLRCREVRKKFDFIMTGKEMQKTKIVAGDKEAAIHKHEIYQATNHTALTIEGRHDEINKEIYYRWLIWDASLPILLSVLAMALLAISILGGS